jgi:hypothetical protein
VIAQQSYHFNVAEVPYFNSLTAGQLDASTSFDASTPESHLAYSLQSFANFLTPGVESRGPKTVEPVGYTQDPRNPSRVVPVQLPPMEMLQGLGGAIGAVGSQKTASGCGYFDFGCQAEKLVSGDTVKDIGKRIGLSVLALVLIALAIVSLR